MKLNDSTKQYLVDEIINYYENKEKSLIDIFTLNQEIFGINFYGDIIGDSFNSKVVDLVNELIKQRKLEDFITIVRQKFYPIFANKYVGMLLIKIFNDIFREDPDKFLKCYQLFISNLDISNFNISKKIKETIPEIETSEDITKFINMLMQIDEEQEDSSYIETFVCFIIETSSFQENQLREWSKNYIKDYNGLKKLILKPKKFSDHFSNIFRKKIFFLRFILELITVSLILLFLHHHIPRTDPSGNHIPTTDLSGDYIFVSGRTEQAMVYYDWIVTDKDSKGLNCRIPSKDKCIDVLETLLDENYIDDIIIKWEVMTTFKTGTRLRPVTTQLGTNIFLKDKQGKLWVPVDKNPIGNKYYGATCFVRANKLFIEPVPRIIPSPK